MGKRAAPTRIQKSGSGHQYFLDGEKVPGVTTILGNGIPKPALMDWAAREAADFVVNRLGVVKFPSGKTMISADDVVADLLAWNETRTRPEKVGTGEVLPRLALAKILKDIRYRDLDLASGKGTDVHNLGAALARGEEVVVPELLAGHVESYVRFLDEWDPTDALVERVVVNRKWRYMGKFDLRCQIAGVEDPFDRGLGDPDVPDSWLLDIKTSRSGIFAEVALQLEGYDGAETMLDGDQEVPYVRADRIGAIHVRADGYDVYEFRRHPSTFLTFLYAKQVGDWLDWKDGPAATIKSDSLPAPRPRVAS